MSLGVPRAHPRSPKPQREGTVASKRGQARERGDLPGGVGGKAHAPFTPAARAPYTCRARALTAAAHAHLQVPGLLLKYREPREGTYPSSLLAGENTETADRCSLAFLPPALLAQLLFLPRRQALPRAAGKPGKGHEDRRPVKVRARPPPQLCPRAASPLHARELTTVVVLPSAERNKPTVQIAAAFNLGA